LSANSLAQRCVFLDTHKYISLVFSDYNLEIFAGKIEPSYLRQKKFLSFFEKNISYHNGSNVIFNAQFYYKYLLFSPMPIWTGVVMMRREVVKEIGLFRTSIFVGEDADYWLRILEKRIIGFIDKPLAIYRHFAGNLTKQPEKGDIGGIQLLSMLYKTNQNEQMRKILRKRLAYTYYTLGYFYRKNNLPLKARKYLFASMRHNPLNFRVYKSMVATMLAHKKAEH
jgi:hypothetical protein